MIHHIVTFFVSIGISLYRGWKLALVLLALTPLIAAAGFALARIMTWGSKRMSEGYAKANVTSSQAIGNIRTVASFQAEPMLYDKYVQSLETPTRTSVKIYTFNGIAGGCVKAAIFVTCALALLSPLTHVSAILCFARLSNLPLHKLRSVFGPGPCLVAHTVYGWVLLPRVDSSARTMSKSSQTYLGHLNCAEGLLFSNLERRQHTLCLIFPT